MSKVFLTSTNIDSVDYDKNSKNLTVDFQNGRSYVYEGVSADTVTDLVFAESPGRFLNLSIKPKHKVRQILEQD